MHARNAVGGSIGYLFSDIEDSTGRWERTPERMHAAVQRQYAIIEECVSRCGGVIHDRAGDGVFAIFASGNPLQCALDLQLAMQDEDWSAVGGLDLRVGVHISPRSDSGAPDQTAINRAARITASGWGGQIVVSQEAMWGLAAPQDAAFVDLGVCHYKGIAEPLHLHGLVHPQLKRTQFPPLRSSTRPALQLPQPPGPLFGREREMAEISRRLEAERFLTIVGAGGVGKTRLAEEIGAHVARGRAVAFVLLDMSASGCDLAPAIARALHYPVHGPETTERQLIAYLREHDILLVIDSSESIAGHADFLSDILAACAGVRILATSREPLRAAGESIYRLGGLPGDRPDGDGLSPAYQLFAFEARAHGVHRPFDDEADHFAELCRLVDGSPLALRLIAKWSRVLSLGEILAQLQDRGAMSSTPAAVAPRSALREVFDESWRRLSPDQQIALARLSVFAGPFDWNAAAAVADVNFATFAMLVDKCLLDESAPRKFSLHSLVREYAREKLSLSPEHEASSLARHSRHYLTLLCAEAVPSGDGDSRALSALQDEFANIKTAWRQAIAEQSDIVRQAALPLHHFLTLRSMTREGVELFSIDPEDAQTRLLFQGVLAATWINRGDLAAAEAAALGVFAGRGAIVARALARDALGGVSHVRGRHSRAQHHYERAFALWTRVGSELNASFSVMNLALLQFERGDLAATARWSKLAYRLSKKSGNSLGLRVAQMLAGDVLMREGRLDTAKLNYERALQLDRGTHASSVSASILRRFGAVHMAMDDAASALQYHRQAFELAKEVGERRTQAHALVEIGEDLQRLGRPHDAHDRALEGVRRALEIGVDPLVSRGLMLLAELERDFGRSVHAKRILRVLAARLLGEMRPRYEALAHTLHVEASIPVAHEGVEDILDDIAVAAALGLH